MFAIAFNKATNTVLNLGCNHEMGFHGITHHVSNLIDNKDMHGLIVTVHGEMLVSIVAQGKAADNSSLRGTYGVGMKGLFISWSIVGDSDALSCTRSTLVKTGSVGEPGLLLEPFVMCMQERQRKGSLGLITCWFRVFGSA